MGRDDDDGGSKSVFNAGVAQAMRIDALQKALNAARFNPLIFNMEVGTYNYEVIINSLNSLFHEAWSKLSKEEKKDGDKIYTTIKKLLKSNPPVQHKTINNEQKIVTNIENWEKLDSALVIYERKVKEYLDTHDLNSPNRDKDEDDW